MSIDAVRSLLFAPGSNPRMLSNACGSGADAVIFDLEDSVAPSARADARSAVAAALDENSGRPGIFVRVNHPSTGLMNADLDFTVRPGLSGVVLPKTESPIDVARLDEALAEREVQAHLPVGSIAILPLVESCRGLHDGYEIARQSPRIVGMAFSSGEQGDFISDLGGQWTQDGAAMLYPRSKLVCDTRAAGLRWPVDGVVMNLADTSVLESECRLARRLGYQAKMAIHPKQLDVIHAVFTPTEEEIEASLAVVRAHETAQARGTGAFSLDGMMVDQANVERAKRILARAKTISQGSRASEAGCGS
jgi:citrate lyase subunit beta / citryl-CoA lyase